MQALASAVLTMECIVGGFVTPDAAGTWLLEMQWPGGASTGTCTFTQDQQRLTGTCAGETDRFPVHGMLKERKVSLLVEVAQDGAQSRMEFDGEFDDSFKTIKGTCNVGDQFGSFTMTKQ